MGLLLILCCCLLGGTMVSSCLCSCLCLPFCSITSCADAEFLRLFHELLTHFPSFFYAYLEPSSSLF